MMMLRYLLILMIGLGGSGLSALESGEETRPIAISNIRRVSPEQIGDQFCWGNDSQLIYLDRHPSGTYIYRQDLATGQTQLITKGISPAFRKYVPKDPVFLHDSIYFLRSPGYGGSEHELWEYSDYTNTHGECRVSAAILQIERDLFLSPVDDRVFVYRYGCSMAEGGFQQIRMAKVKDRNAPDFDIRILFSRPFVDGAAPSISGWLDENTLICFRGEEPVRLKTISDWILPPHETPAQDYNLEHYPDNGSEFLIRGLNGIEKVLLPGSNFAPDGKSYFIYSIQRKAIIQKTLRGKEVAATPLPDTVRYEDDDIWFEHPRISRDGRHLGFLGEVKTAQGDRRVVYLADLEINHEARLCP